MFGNPPNPSQIFGQTLHLREANLDVLVVQSLGVARRRSLRPPWKMRDGVAKLEKPELLT